MHARWTRQILIILLLVLIVVIGNDMVTRFLYEASGAFNGDSPIYWAVGRGIANGFSMYTDLFDIKPPGIFLLSALSYEAAGDMSLGHIAQGLVIALLPLVIVLPWIALRRTLQTTQYLLGLVILLAFGGAIAVYTGILGGEFQTESFGVFFACIYVGCALAARERDGWLWPCIAGIPFFLAIFIKEPFVIACALSGLVLCRSRRDVLRMVIVPGLVGGLLFLASLLVLGVFDGYMGYLTFMSSARTQRFGSPVSRAVLTEMIAFNLWHFSPLLAVFLLLVWLRLLMRGLRTDAGSTKDWLLFAGFLLSLAALSYGIQSMRILPGQPIHWRPVQSPVWIGIGAVSLIALWRTATRHCSDRTVMHMRIAVPIVALFGIGYMTGLSGEFVGHHFLFAISVYTALVIACLDIFTTSESRFDRWMAGVTTGLIVLTVLLPHQVTDYAARRLEWSAEAKENRELAAVIDTALDRCRQERYLIVGEAGTNVFGYTRHSPFGPIFFQHTLVLAYPSFTKAFVQELLDTEVILIRKSGGRPNFAGVDHYISRNFSETPPPCAGELPPITTGHALLFRTGQDEVSLTFMENGEARLAIVGEE